MVLSRDDYFEVALQVLAESGFPALSASALCDRMGITRGSFYHHFESFDEFIDGLLSQWEHQVYTGELRGGSFAVDDLAARFEIQSQRALSLPHGAEIALRAWATVNSRVADSQRRIDQLRHEVIVRSLIEQGVPSAVAEVHADIAVNAFVGAQMKRASSEHMGRMFEEIAGQLVALAAAHASD